MPLQKGHVSILDFDDTTPAIIEPKTILKKLDTMPERVVMPFFMDVVETVCADATVIFELGSEIGKNPVYLLETQFGDVAVMHPGVGAPLAAAFMEEAIAVGGSKFMACGGAGVLVRDIAMGHVIIPDTAIRDEGTSYHYLPAEAEARAHPAAIEAIKNTLDRHHLPYDVGKVWTTDAIYRETRAIVEDRVAQGCLLVEMEAAAFMAVAEFRDVVFGQLLYGGDTLAGDEWDNRGWQKEISTREKLFWLAVEAVCAL